MSESYEAVVFRSTGPRAVDLFRRHAGRFAARLVHLGGSAFGVYRTATAAPSDADAAAVDALAAAVSEAVGVCLSVFYDNQCGVRASALFRDGLRAASFGAGDDLWVPLDDGGHPRADVPPVRVPDWDGGEEYERVSDGIDAGLRAAGLSDRVTRPALLDAFCYDRAAVLAEAG